jgi:hypothetical protein
MEVRIQVSTWQWNGGQDTGEYLAMEWRSGYR